MLSQLLTGALASLINFGIHAVITALIVLVTRHTARVTNEMGMFVRLSSLLTITVLALMCAREPAELLQQYANFAGGYVTQNGGPGSRPERSDGVKYQPENERPNRRSEIGAA